MALISPGHPLYGPLEDVFRAAGLLDSVVEVVLADVNLDLPAGVVHYEVAVRDEAGDFIMEGQHLAVQDRHLALDEADRRRLESALAQHLDGAL